MFELLNMLDNIIYANYTEDYDKIEFIIKSNDMYKCLDMDEQEILLEEVKEKHTAIMEKKKNLTDVNPTYKDAKPYLKKSNYKHGHIVEQPELYANSEGIMMTEGEIMSDRVKAKMIKEPTEEDIIRRSNIFNETKILSADMPAQKSEGWHALRYNTLGGSVAGTVLSMNKHQPQYTVIIDKVLGAEFKGNAWTYHGNVFEDVVRMMYEYNNDVHTEEFSSMAHKTNKILAASPDGIVSPYARDLKTPTKLVGRMLEIKCPTQRKIQYAGDIKDTICPIYYWCQIQQQLECLDLDECDFIQCNIERYESRDSWIADTNPECEFKSRKYNNLRGVVIELIPLKLNECDYNEKGHYADMTIWTKTKCLYPPKIDMKLKELDDWILSQLSNLPWGYTLHEIIYWRLVEQNCTLVLRDKEWFNSQLPTYNKIWNYILYLRENLDVIEEWVGWIEGQARKYNNKIMMKLDELINKKEKTKQNNINAQNVQNIQNVQNVKDIQNVQDVQDVQDIQNVQDVQDVQDIIQVIHPIVFEQSDSSESEKQNKPDKQSNEQSDKQLNQQSNEQLNQQSNEQLNQQSNQNIEQNEKNKQEEPIQAVKPKRKYVRKGKIEIDTS